MIIPIIGFGLERLDREMRRGRRRSTPPYFYCSLGLYSDTAQYKLLFPEGGTVSSYDLSLGCTPRPANRLYQSSLRKSFGKSWSSIAHGNLAIIERDLDLIIGAAPANGACSGPAT
jgi:hypothetical protein